MIEKLKDTNTIEPLRATEDYDESDIQLSSEESEKFTGMLSMGLNTEVDPIETQGELEGAAEYAREQLLERQKEDTVNIAEQMVRQSALSPEEVLQFVKRKPIDVERPIETLYVANNLDRTMTDDDTNGSALSLDTSKQYEFGRVSLNRIATQRALEELRRSYNKFGIKRVFTTVFTPAELARRKALSTVGEANESFSLSKIERVEAEFDRNKMLELSSEEYEKYLANLIEAYKDNPDILADRLEGALEYRTPGIASDVFVGVDTTFAAVPLAKGVAAGIEVTTKQGLKEGAKELGKGAVKTAGNVIPFSDVLINSLSKKLVSTGKVIQSGLEDAPKSVVKNDKLFLNRRGADAKLASKIENGEFIFEPKYVSEENVSTAMSPRVAAETTAPIDRMPKTEEANRKQEALRAVSYQLDSAGYSLEKLEDEALQDALTQWYIKNPKLSSNLADVVDLDFIDMADGNVGARIMLGNGAGLHNPFTTKESAEAFAKTLNKEGLSGIQIISDGAGYWVWADVKLKKSRGVIVNEFLQPDSGKNGSFKGGLWGYVTQVASTPTDVMTLGNFVQKQSNDIQNIFKNAKKSYDSLSKAEKAQVDYLVEVSRMHEEYITETAMKESGYSEAVVNAYNNMRLLNDVEYIAKQRALTRAMSADGLKRITVYPDKGASEGIVTGRIINPDSFSEKRYFFIEETGAERIPFKLTKAQFNEKYSKIYDIVEYIHATDGIPAANAYHLVPKKTIKVNDLDEVFSSYVPGFRHVYDNNTTFIKQLRTSKLPEGEEVVSSIETLFGEGNRKLAIAWAKEAEIVRKAIAEFEEGSTRFASRAALDKFVVDNGHIGRWSSAQDFKEFAAKHGISLKPKDTIEAVKHGETLKSLEQYKHALDDDALRSLDRLDDFNFALKQAGRSNAGKIDRAARKTSYDKPLTGINGDRTPYLDTRAEMQRAIRNIENITTWDTYSKLYADNYYNLFKDVIPSGMSPAKALSTGALVAATEKNIHRINAARKAKRTHDYMRGLMTHADVTIANVFSRILNSIGERFDFLKDLPLVGDAFVEGSNLQRQIATLAPVKYLRWSVSQMYLGLCNVRQLYVQALSAVHTIEISPVAGVKAIPFGFIMGPLIAKSDKAAIKAASKALSKAGSEVVSESWLSNFIEVAKKLDVYGRSARGGAIDVSKEAISTKLDRATMAPYRAGEAYNRYHSVATTIFEELKKGTKIEHLLKMDEKTRARLLTRQNNLYMNMNKTGVAPIQQGNLLSVALQMKGFQMKYIESFFNRNLTVGEKMRMAIGDILLTGFGGWAGVNTYKWLNTDREMSSTEKFAAQTFEEGLTNSLMTQYFGSRIDWSEPMSVSMLDLVDNIWKMDTGEIALSGVAKRAMKGFDVIYNHVQKYKYGSLTAERFKELVDMLAVRRALPSGANNAVLGWQIAETGNLYASSGLITASGLSKVEAVATALGLKLRDETQVYKLNSIRYDKKERVNKVFEGVLPYWNDMLSRGTEDSRKTLFNLYAMYCDRYDLNHQEKSEVWNRLESTTKSGLLKSSYERFLYGLIRDSGFEKANIMDKNYRR